MRNSDAVRQLLAELQQDMLFIEDNAQKNRVMSERIMSSPEPDEFEYAALGFTLHNLYNAFEGYFFRVAKFFENNVEDLTWHKSLLERMTLHIEGIRPALIERDIAGKIEELLKFRHVFRNIYKSPLVPAKIKIANDMAVGIDGAFKNKHEAFCLFLRELIMKLESGV